MTKVTIQHIPVVDAIKEGFDIPPLENPVEDYTLVIVHTFHKGREFAMPVVLDNRYLPLDKDQTRDLKKLAREKLKEKLAEEK